MKEKGSLLEAAQAELKAKNQIIKGLREDLKQAEVEVHFERTRRIRLEGKLTQMGVPSHTWLMGTAEPCVGILD